MAALPLVALGVTGPSFWFNGMETGVLLTVVAAIMLVYVRSDGLTAPWWDTRRSLWFGALLALAVMARLDAIVAALLIGGDLMLRDRRALWPVAVVPALVLSGYLLGNQLVFGAAIPVSGQAKALGGTTVTLDDLRQFVAAPVVLGVPLWGGAAALVLVVAAVLRPGPLASMTRLGRLLIVAALCITAYYTTTSSWQLWPWYFYLSPVVVVVALPVAASRLPPRAATVLGALVAVGSMLLATAGMVRATTTSSSRDDYLVRAPDVAATLGRLAPGQAVAMGDRAGAFGYHLAAPLVHLEGLVGPPGYLTALRTGTVDAFLAAHGVGIYGRADDAPGLVLAGGQCRQFSEPQQGQGPKARIVVCDDDLLLRVPLADGTEYRFWRYDPHP